jgi:putative ABC transport system permease protein
VTAFLNVRFRILHLLASILTMFALLSVSLRIMGRPNISLLRQETIFTPVETFLQSAAGDVNVALDAFQDALFLGYDVGFDLNFASYMMTPLFLAVLIVVVVLALNRFLGSNFGLGMRAIGVNKKMAQAQGIRVGANIYVGMGLSNGLVGLAGALFAQSQTFADVTSGQGTIVVGLAAVIVGDDPAFAASMALVGCVLGSIIYHGAAWRGSRRSLRLPSSGST